MNKKFIMLYIFNINVRILQAFSIIKNKRPSTIIILTFQLPFLYISDLHIFFGTSLQ